MVEFSKALVQVTLGLSYKTLLRCHARNTKQFWCSSRGRSPFKNSPFNEKLFANRNSCIAAAVKLACYFKNSVHFYIFRLEKYWLAANLSDNVEMQ